MMNLWDTLYTRVGTDAYRCLTRVHKLITADWYNRLARFEVADKNETLLFIMLLTVVSDEMRISSEWVLWIFLFSNLHVKQRNGPGHRVSKSLSWLQTALFHRIMEQNARIKITSYRPCHKKGDPQLFTQIKISVAQKCWKWLCEKIFGMHIGYM